ncbi:hypothetical protein JCM19238_3044 [Vibrio ponticus]|nr:hypothetical protein JCM19238_3044 [Vibrio ponticus]
MNKQSLLAASVMLGLVGCGGDSDNNSASTNSVTLTAFDGYLSNALVFIDQNNDSQWNSGERILGLTNDAGKLTLGSRPDGVIAVQTLTPNGPVQQQLANDHPEYSNVYTIDMDRPAQPITYELVLKTPASSNTLSPLTDLVVLEMAAGATESQAIENINNALGKNISPYSNYLDGNEADAELHKLAQILTETKGNNGVDEYAQNRLNVITKAQQLVDEIVSDNSLDIEDKNYIPTIEIANDNSLSSKTNHLVVVNQESSTQSNNKLMD